ncbi:single-stranded DNA-binding protein [Barnesiella viscericola]|uniref:single-stranded DNA-binding protein n=1 Tax=Barnesiella viscericola TaxID=397865 RepID=UPI0025A3693D|nr:single-stranded DNA-binding protein [Barnesiella viscericola]MDM8267590.1 single-stranded DNA-binding protein [Barnesiella viscericola]
MSVNKVILIGNVGKDPDVRYIENNVCVANFTLATTERGYTTQSGVQIPDKTEWHNIVAWRGLAEVAEKYVRKGTQLYIEGKIRTRSWEDQNKIRRYTTEIYVDNMELLGRRDGQTTAASAPAAQPQAQPQSYQAPANPGNTVAGGNSADDDLPF